MDTEFQYLGSIGLQKFKIEVRFGDLVKNHYASDDNPSKVGVFVRMLGRAIECTDMRGNFWRPVLDERSKLEIVGSILWTKCLLNQR